MKSTIADAQRGLAWREIEPTSLRQVRAMLILKHGNLSSAANALRIPYQRLSHACAGRDMTVWVIAAIQNDLRLSNSQVLALWPLLKVWPKEGRRAA